MTHVIARKHTALILAGLMALFTGLALFISSHPAQAQTSPNTAADLAPLHPTFALLDSNGDNVLDSGNPVSGMTTCGTCHDTAFIAQHSIHRDGGIHLDDTALLNRDKRTDAEMNCFICHLDKPDNAARLAALAADQSAWASTATLNATDILTGDANGWQYNEAAFDADGLLLPQSITLAEPSDANCAQCHGVAHSDARDPLTFDLFDTANWQTMTTGQVFSPQRISNSGLNIAGKTDTARTWDVHAERAVNCVDCHYSLNNPIFYREGDASRPDHLQFDPRRLEFGEYLQQPLHVFANSNAGDNAPLSVTGRTCSSCHETATTHQWLPYAEGHMQTLACETCHVPEMPANSLEFVDYTVLTTTGDSIRGYRGLDTTSSPPLITGSQPTLLLDDDGRIAPHNLVSVWYWATDAGAIPLDDVQTAYTDDSSDYTEAIMQAFDADNSGSLEPSEQVLDSEIKTSLITQRLSDLGYDAPFIQADTQPYALHHGVTNGANAIRACESCHSEESRLNQPVTLASRTPGDVLPTFNGAISDTYHAIQMQSSDGLLTFQAQTPPNLYVFGKHSVQWIDTLGVLLFLATLLGVVAHGGLRYVMAKRNPAPHDPELREVYMYSVYERQWHWLQSAAIFGLIFTGLVIHKPDVLGVFSFRYNVLIHNALALVLVINAALAAFYHLVSGEIRQYLPQPRGFFGKMFAQARYYLWGIFHDEPHPFEKTPESKLNPIQQLTYFGLLNVLLPLQVITGVAMWGAQEFPQITNAFGGLPLLAPFHTLIAWLLATFIVLHVYMTTTGHTPLASIRAMITGRDEVEIHPTPDHPSSNQPDTPATKGL